MWARIKNAEKCYEHIKHFISTRLNDNLWGTHPPFQIDGNFGFTASISEMLLQSQSGFLEVLPSVPSEWESGEFKGLVARGNFVVSCKWENGKIKRIKIISKQGGKLNIKLPTYLLPKGYKGDIYTKDTKINEQIVFK
jgi:alpha-L-fucosidase 2